MAADQALLESAVHGVASLRFYGWSPATLSLGYFQSEGLRHADPRLAELPLVRRPSGGAALIHHHEVTYGLALPAGLPWQSSESWLCRMHAIIAAALKASGVAAALHDLKAEQPVGGVLCFLHFTPGDLVLGGGKIVGSAQRRQRGALLQHGSILLRQSAYAPALPGVLELSGRALSAAELCVALEQAFQRSTGWLLEEGGWTGAELERIEHLRTTKYTQDSWNRKR
jgi:lipoyl(octanoyl) transferase